MNTEIISAMALVGASAVGYSYYAGKNHKFSVKFHQEGVLYRHGKFVKILAAGEHKYFGSGYELVKVDKRSAQMVIQPQEIFTQDLISIKVSGIIQYKVVDAQKFNELSEQPLMVVYSLVQIALRDAVSELSLDEINVNRKQIVRQAMLNLGDRSLEVGVEVTEISVRDLIFPNEIKSAYHDTVCAQKRSLAKLESARGEVAAARAMANASKQYAQNPEMMQLRYLDVLQSAADSMGNTFVIKGLDEDSKILNLK